MTDIVERLSDREKDVPSGSLYHDARVEIERLRKLLRLKMLDADHLRERKAELLKEIERTT